MGGKKPASPSGEAGPGVAHVPVGESWPAAGSILQFAELLQEGVPRLDPASYVTTGSHDTFELMVHPRRRTPTSSCLLSPLFCSILGLPTGLYLDFSCSKEWEVVIDHYRKPSIALRIRPQNILLWILDRRLYIGRHLQATWWASMWRGTSTRQDGP